MLKLSQSILLTITIAICSINCSAQWQSVPTNPITPTKILQSVAFSNNVGFIVSSDDDALYYSSDFGSHWTRKSTLEIVRTKIITTKPHTFFTNGFNNGYFYSTRNDGTTWDSVYVNDYIDYISFPTPKIGYAKCRYPAIFTTSDSGKSWQPIKTTGCVEPWLTHYYMTFSSPSKGFVWGAGTIVSSSSDSGKSFVCDSVLQNDSFVYCINFPSPAVGYICGSFESVYKTIDSGRTWVSAGIGINVGTLLSVYFLNDSCGYACGIWGAVFYTSNGGKTWIRQQTGTYKTLYDIYFTNKDTGYAVGDSGIFIRTFNGGFAGLKTIINQNSTISVFPNPTKGTFSINLPEDESGFVEVMDVSGKILKTESFEGSQIRLNLPELPPGMYLFHLSTKNGAYYGKVIIS